MAEPRFANAADAEFSEALLWYAERNPTAAERFEAEIGRIVTLIGRSPELFPRCDRRHRQAMLQGFPYRVVFRDDEAVAVVVAVAHHRRRPNYWRGRNG